MTPPQSTEFRLFVTYSQIVVCLSSLERPFNRWTDRHVRQGFAWRPGSVSFATIEEGGEHRVEVAVSKGEEASGRAGWTIEVPFQVPEGQSLEVASMSESVPLEITPGLYLLRYEAFEAAEGLPRIRLAFSLSAKPAFKVVRADSALSPGDGLLTTAEPA